MLILMGIVPAGFAINLALSEPQMREASAAVVTIHDALGSAATSAPDVRARARRGRGRAAVAQGHARHRVRPEQVPAEQRFAVRRDVLLIDSTLKKLDQSARWCCPRKNRPSRSRRRAPTCAS